MDFEGLKRRKKTVIAEKELETSGETVETSTKEKSKNIPVVIPYVKGFSEQMRRVFGKYGIPTYFKPTNTLVIPQLQRLVADIVLSEHPIDAPGMPQYFAQEKGEKQIHFDFDNFEGKTHTYCAVILFCSENINIIHIILN